MKSFIRMDNYVHENTPLLQKLKDQMIGFTPNEFLNCSIQIRSIHDHRNICFNCEYREILYAIESCINQTIHLNTLSKQTSFKENVFGKCVTIPTVYVQTHIDRFSFESFYKYFKYHFRNRIEKIEKSYLRTVSKEYIKDLIPIKENAFCDYFDVFYISSLPMELRKYIQSFLLCNYKSLAEVRVLFDRTPTPSLLPIVKKVGSLKTIADGDNDQIII